MAARDGKKFKVVVLLPEVPGFSGDIKDQKAIKTIMAGQVRCVASAAFGCNADDIEFGRALGSIAL